MEFLLIMGIGTVLAILIVIGSRPKRPTVSLGVDSPARRFSPSGTPPWKKDIARSHPVGDLEYLEGVERYHSDPQSQPFPLPPPKADQKC